MKKNFFIVALMMLSISTTLANDSLRRVEVVVLSQYKNLISEIAITEINEPGRMTIVYDTLQTFKVSEEAKPWITQNLAYKLVEVWNDENMYAKHVWVPEDIKIYPKWTKLFVHKYTEVPHKLVISENGVSYQVVNSRRTDVKEDKFLPIILMIIGISLLAVFFTYVALYNKIKAKHILFAMMCTLIMMVSFEFIVWDGLLMGIGILGPSYLSTFLFFQTRTRKHKLEKVGWKVDQPLKVFENGDVLLVHKYEINENPQIRLFDKKYRMSESQPYSCEEMRWIDGLFYLIYDREKMTYGLFDVLIWEMVLDIKYKSIRNQTGRHILSTKVEGEKSRLFDLNDRIFLSDAKAI